MPDDEATTVIAAHLQRWARSLSPTDQAALAEWTGDAEDAPGSAGDHERGQALARRVSDKVARFADGLDEDERAVFESLLVPVARRELRHVNASPPTRETS